jgi:hypothetical protein
LSIVPCQSIGICFFKISLSTVETFGKCLQVK